MDITHKLKDIGSTLRLDRHSAMERSLVVFTVMMLSLVGILVTSGTAASRKYSADLGTTAIYVNSTKTSKTQVPVDVQGLFVSQDRTKAMLLMKFEDMSKMSADASTYQSFLTASDAKLNKETLKTPPSGSIYVFGSTGYIGVYLANAEGFTSQVLNLTLRANTELVTPSDVVTTGDPQGDPSFENYDQWRVYFNPGAAGATHAASLDAANPELKSLYNEMVIVPQERELRGTLNEDLLQLKADLTKIEDYTKRLTMTSINGVRVMAPEPPAQVAGDKVTGGEPATDGKPATPLRLETETTVPRGFDFDWQDGSVEQGYLDEITPEGMSYLTYMTNKSAETGSNMDVSKMQFPMSDGTMLSDLTAASSSSSADLPTIESLNTSKNLLTQAYQTYYQNKQRYQAGDLAKLLALEVSLRDVTSNHSVNTDPKAVRIY